MPTYPNVGAQGSQKGVPVTVWNAETPASGNGGASASMALALPEAKLGGIRPFRVLLTFSGVPGAFEVDVQTADVNVEAAFSIVANGAISAVDANNNAVFELPTNTANFVRLLGKTQNANGRSVTATIKPV